MTKQLSSKIVYQNPWMTVREDQVEFTQGKQGIFGVVEKSDFVMIIPFADGHIYLVKQYRYPIQRDVWEFPAGMYEKDPMIDVMELAKRELAEETGLRAGEMKKIGFLYEADGYCTQGFHIFLATELVEGQQKLEDSEHGMTVGKFTIAELEKMISSGEIVDSPTVAGYGVLKAQGQI